MLDQAIRFGVILAQPEFKRGGNLLEVGSGFRGISAFIRDAVVGVDIQFGDKPTAGVIAVRASATALPLRDGCFDRVVCSDMLEHLRAPERSTAIGELLRVTKRTLFLACPCDEGARQADDKLAKLYRLLRVQTPDWLEDHQQKGLPEAEAIRYVLRQCGVAWREIPGESTLTHLLVSMLISSRLLNRWWETIFSKKPHLAIRIAQMHLFSGIRRYRRLWVINIDK